MSIPGCLLSFGLRYVLRTTADQIVGVFESHFTDHGQALPRALARANDRAWEAVGLALAGDSLFGWIKDFFRDGDLRGVRDQIKQFLDQTPTGLETTTESFRAQAAKEWNRLRQAGRLAATTVPPTEITHRAASLERYSDPAQIARAALQTVQETAALLRSDSPHLAELLTKAPPGGTPLLAAAFAFFFRREVETNAELAHGLSFDLLRQIGDQQERGLGLLDSRTTGILDQLAGLFKALEGWFEIQGNKLDEINAKLDHLVRLRDVPTSTSEPLRVTVTNRDELALLQSLRDRLRSLPPELVAAADWSRLGDTLAAAGLFREAGEAHDAAAATAQALADRQAEAEAEYKKFRDACETGDREAAMLAFRRAIELDAGRFAPFDLHRYRPVSVLGIGGFGTVFLAHDEYESQQVAIKAIHDSGWQAVLERDLSETFREASTLARLNHPNIVKQLGRGFGDPAGRRRPFLVPVSVQPTVSEPPVQRLKRLKAEIAAR